METLDIVQLIEKNPITRFSDDKYQNRFIEKIKMSFTESQQHLFIASFYCYLNYEKKDFVIDLDNVWRWLGFSRKDPAKVVLTKHFVENVDYIIEKVAPEGAGMLPKQGGLNKETILMNITTFKKLCMKSCTKKADEIHDYFIKLEEIVQEIVNEESEELKLQLTQQKILSQQELEQQRIQSEKQKELVREKTILEHFPENIQCIYYGFIDNQTDAGQSLIKFGNSNGLLRRVGDHKRTFDNFRLVNAFRVENKTEMENELKNHPKLKPLRTTLVIKNQNQTELWVNSLTLQELDDIILDIITRVEFSRKNYSILLKKNEDWAKKYEDLTKENQKLKQELSVVSELLKRQVSAHAPPQPKRRHASTVSNVEISFTKKPNPPQIPTLIVPDVSLSLNSNETPQSEPPALPLVGASQPQFVSSPYVNEQQILSSDELPIIQNNSSTTHFQSDIVLSDNVYDYKKNKLRRISKNKDGVYVIGGESFPKLFGTREEVWNKIAYKTVGELTIINLMISEEGKIVSKSKCKRSKTINQFTLNKPNDTTVVTDDYCDSS